MRAWTPLIAALLVLGPGAALGDAVPQAPVVGSVPLSQASVSPDRAAAARVANADGKVIGTVQKVELRDGRPVRVEVALLGGEGIVSLDASTLRYDAASNVISSTGPLRARPQA